MSLTDAHSGLLLPQFHAVHEPSEQGTYINANGFLLPPQLSYASLGGVGCSLFDIRTSQSGLYILKSMHSENLFGVVERNKYRDTLSSFQVHILLKLSFSKWINIALFTKRHCQFHNYKLYNHLPNSRKWQLELEIHQVTFPLSFLLSAEPSFQGRDSAWLKREGESFIGSIFQL